MNSSNRSNVFELSLTEIAFILIFILLLLLGGLYLFQYRENKRLTNEVATYRDSVGSILYLDSIRNDLAKEVQNTSNLSERDAQRLLDKVLDHRIDEQRYHVLNELFEQIEQSDGNINTDYLTQLMQEKHNLNDLKTLNQLIEQNLTQCKNPDEFISSLITKDDCAKEKFNLESKITELSEDLKLVQQKNADLIAVQNYLENDHLTADEFLRMNELNDLNGFLVENQIAIPELKDTIEKNAQLQTQLEEQSKESHDLIGQLEYLKSKLNGNGIDYPPCWVDINGKIEYLFMLDLYPDFVRVSRAWPDSRQDDARDLPNAVELSGKNLSYSNFLKLSTPIFNVGKNKEVECRYFVKLRSHIPTTKESDLVRRRIEALFYKLELNN